MPNALTRKLGNGAKLSDDDCDYLDRIAQTARTVPPKNDLVRQGQSPGSMIVIMEGTACRYKLLPDGQRSIVSLCLPGDFSDMHAGLLDSMDHSFGTLTECRVVDLSPEIVETLLERPGLAGAMARATLVDQAILREWLANMGRRRSDRQFAHLLCEVHERLRMVGRRQRIVLSLTHEQIADILGITSVHVQRVSAELRKAGLIETKNRSIRIPDIDLLKAFAEFEGDYLHLPGS